jgi:hypothetical protein
MEKICKFCNKTFNTNHSKKIFCERKCKIKWFDTDKEKRKQYREKSAKKRNPQTCEYCNNEFLNYEKRRFCSIQCCNSSRNKLDYSDCKTEKEKRAKYWRHYYSQTKNKKKHIKRVGNTNILVRKKFNEFKLRLQCQECGENHIATLDFHHENKDSKSSTISALVHGCNSWDLIMSEIKKCVVLCSNCHRKLHYNLKKK